jgi:L-fucose isomerase-like protein
MALRVKTIAHRNAEPVFLAAGRKRLDMLFPSLFEHIEGGLPEVIFFLSGGSEHAAVSSLKPGCSALLLAGYEDNAFAAAMEVAAWAGNQKIPVRLISMEEAEKSPILKDLNTVCEAFRRLEGKRAGLIGEVSHWLVASGVQKDHAREKLGLDVVHIPWKDLPDYAAFPPDSELLEVFRAHRPEKLNPEAGILGFLKQVVNEHRLDALTLECFNMVKDKDVTACLSLALLNSQGFPAGCEGDLVSLAGMMLAKELTGVIPWMANVAAISGGSILFAHCTVPLNLVDSFRVDTHFETGKSAAIKGKTNMDQVTVFRLNNGLDKAFVAEGEIVSRPGHGFACRTQSEVILSPSDYEKIKQHPLGNHHLLLPGNHRPLLELACRHKGIQLV